MSVYAYDSNNENLIPVAASSTDFIGATASTAGTHGLVPAPLAADLQKFLSAKGSWEYAGNIFYGTRTEWNQLTAAQKAIFSSDNMGIVCLYNDGIFEYDVTNDTLIVLSSRGHVIKNESGTAFTERSNLQIKNGFVSDDSTNDATIIESDNFVGTQAQWNALSAAEQAKYKSKDIVDDTVYGAAVMTGATAQTDGTSGLTPQPLAGDEDKVLQGSGSFGKKLQTDIVIQNNQYGFVGNNNKFEPFITTKIKTIRATQVAKDWIPKTWNGLTNFSGWHVWTDGDNVYYSEGTTHYVLNKTTSTWSEKTWSGLTNFYGQAVWTDGDNVYYSVGTTHYVLNKTTSTWSEKTWSGLTEFTGNYIWSDGENIYYSYYTKQYVLNKATSTWEIKAWNYENADYRAFTGEFIWSDGINIYHNGEGIRTILNKATSTWSAKTWNDNSLSGVNIWSDGDNIYHSTSTKQYVFDKSTSTMLEIKWNHILSGWYVWTDGDNIYYSNGTAHYVLNEIYVR